MLTQILTIGRLAWLEGLRQPIVLILTLLTGLALVMTVWWTSFAMGYETSAEVHGDNKLLLDVGLATVFVGGLLVSAFLATATLSREIEQRTVLTVVSKPVHRPSVVLGKYLGVAGVLAMAMTIMLVILLLGIRHGVMTTAADDPDGPVLLFGLGAIGLALVVGTLCNYLYGWSFAQVSMTLMVPLMLVAYGLVLVIGKKWGWQSPMKDLKPQVLTACLAQGMAVFVLAALATAVSTRLAQVMTIVICIGAFLVGLMTNHLIGRHAFPNSAVAMIQRVELPDGDETPLQSPRETVNIQLDRSPSRSIRPGDSIYYGSSPNGFPMAVHPFPRFTGNLTREVEVFGPQVPGGLIAREASDRSITIQRIGGSAEVPLRLDRLPDVGDYVFVEPPSLVWPAAVAWALVPNLHYFWLVDAVSQNRPVPMSHLLLLAGYSLTQITALLAIGIMLFQTRDVG
jgi:ABC-2 type transport system permease protein